MTGEHRSRLSRQPSTGVVAHNVAMVGDLDAALLAQRTATERLADRIAGLAGTPWFAIGHIAWFAIWIFVNTGVPGIPAFDPYPFSFLTLVVSLEAIFLTLFVLISQNRLTRQAERRAQLDLQVNLLAEQESTRTLDLLERIAEHLGLASVRQRGDEELDRPTSIRAIVETLERTRSSD